MWFNGGLLVLAKVANGLVWVFLFWRLLIKGLRQLEALTGWWAWCVYWSSTAAGVDLTAVGYAFAALDDLLLGWECCLTMSGLWAYKLLLAFGWALTYLILLFDWLVGELL